MLSPHLFVQVGQQAHKVSLSPSTSALNGYCTPTSCLVAACFLLTIFSFHKNPKTDIFWFYFCSYRSIIFFGKFIRHSTMYSIAITCLDGIIFLYVTTCLDGISCLDVTTCLDGISCLDGALKNNVAIKF